MSVKNFVLGIGIVIIFALVLWQGIEAFYPSPQYDGYCNITLQSVPVPIQKDVNLMNNQTYCLQTKGTWMNGYCDYYYECQKEFDAARLAHSKVVFIIALIAGVIAATLGILFLVVEPVGSALIGSGIWALVWGTAMNWENFTNIWRFLLLFVALVVLIWVTIRLNTKKDKKIRKKGKNR